MLSYINVVKTKIIKEYIRDQSDYISEINEKYAYDLFPSIVQLVNFYYSLSFCQVECERSFSAMKLIKTDRKTLMLNDLLNA